MFVLRHLLYYHFVPGFLFFFFFNLTHIICSRFSESSTQLILNSTLKAESIKNEFKDPFSLETLHCLEFLIKNMSRFGLNDSCPITSEFPCTPFNDEDHIDANLRTATQVRIKDIRFIAALGDSITAGFGMISAKAPQTRLLEFRGQVFSIGKAKENLPHLLETISQQELIGPSLLPTIPLTPGELLNRAITGSQAKDLRLQVLALLEFALPRQPWKLLTILIGANDLCRSCLHPENFSADSYITHIKWVLDTLHRASTNWIVNLMGLFKVSQVFDVESTDPYCFNSVPHRLLCPCLDTPEHRQKMDQLRDEYNLKLQEIAKAYSNFTNFKVNYQPGLVDSSIVPYNQTYISKLDCFHPNLCLNKIFAYALWNNMLEPEGEKKSTVNFENLDWKCPSSDNLYIQ